MKEVTRLVQSTHRALLRRWRRNALTVIALAAGAGAVVAIVGVSESAAQRTAETLAALDATSVMLTLPHDSWELEEPELTASAARLSTVAEVGTLCLPGAGTPQVELTVGRSALSATVNTIIASRDGLAARGAEQLRGSFPTAAATERDPLQLALGAAVAKELNVSAQPGANMLFVNGVEVSVVAVLQDAPGSAAVDSSVVITPQTAEHLGLLPVMRTVVVATIEGSADSTAAVLPAHLWPTAPHDVSASVPPSPQQLRGQLLADSRNLVLVVTLVVILSSGMGIVTTMQISVWERRREIGIARSLGATRGRVAATFLLESIGLGAIGSSVGLLVGAGICAVAASLTGRDLLLPPYLLSVPLLGVVLGAIAGLLPAYAASRVDPAGLLRVE